MRLRLAILLSPVFLAGCSRLFEPFEGTFKGMF